MKSLFCLLLITNWFALHWNLHSLYLFVLFFVLPQKETMPSTPPRQRRNAMTAAEHQRAADDRMANVEARYKQELEEKGEKLPIQCATYQDWKNVIEECKKGPDKMAKYITFANGQNRNLVQGGIQIWYVDLDEKDLPLGCHGCPAHKDGSTVMVPTAGDQTLLANAFRLHFVEDRRGRELEFCEDEIKAFFGRFAFLDPETHWKNYGHWQVFQRARDNIIERRRNEDGKLIAMGQKRKTPERLTRRRALDESQSHTSHEHNKTRENSNNNAKAVMSGLESVQDGTMKSLTMIAGAIPTTGMLLLTRSE